MNKIELLKKIKLLYGMNYSEEVVKANLEAYNKLIKDTKDNIDYDKFYKSIISRWKYSNYMPTPSLIKECILKSIIQPVSRQKVYLYTYLILENSEKSIMKKNEVRAGNKEELIIIKKNGVKFKVINVGPI